MESDIVRGTFFVTRLNNLLLYHVSAKINGDRRTSLRKEILDRTPGGIIDHNTDSVDQTPSSSRLNRSTGSPDSLRSESSSESSLSTSNMILTLDKKAAIVSNGITPDEPKHSYISLISMAILSSEDNKMVLGDIYQFIMNKFPFYNNGNRAWRNSIRHNLSINDCFIKNGRSDNGKGHFWSINPACVEDFAKGDFRRRQARKRARKGGNYMNINYRTVHNYHSHSVSTPMTSSPVAFQPMTASYLGHGHRTPSNDGYQPMSAEVW